MYAPRSLSAAFLADVLLFFPLSMFLLIIRATGLGRRFVTLELKATLSILLRMYHLELLSDKITVDPQQGQELFFCGFSWLLLT
jgi:hypothetical protein